MAKLKVQAQHLQPGDIVGSGEVVQKISAGIHTPKGKVDVWLDKRHTLWGRYTMIGIERSAKEDLPVASRASHYS